MIRTVSKQIRLLTILLSLILSSEANAQQSSSSEIKRLESRIDSLEFENMRQNVRFRSLVQLSSGEFRRLDVDWQAMDDDDDYGYNYRVEIYLSEIYKSLYVSKIAYWGEGIQRIASTIEVDIETLLGLSSEGTNSLEFLDWTNHNEFRVKSMNGISRLQIIDSNQVILIE